MPITICKGCKSMPGKALDYITDKKKAAIVTTHGLNENRNLAKQFIETANLHGKGNKYDERKYYHIKVSFEPKDRVENGGKLTPQLAEKITTEFLQDKYNQHEYVLAIHTDKEHIHAHAIINAVNFENGKKIQHKNKDLLQMKDRINDVAKKYDVSIFDWKKAVKQKRRKEKEISKEPKILTQSEKYIKQNYGEEWTAYSWKETLRSKIDEAKEVCINRSEFTKYLKENYGIEMPRNTDKSISFKHPAIDVTVRGNKLGADYTVKAINEVLKSNFERSQENAKLRFTKEKNYRDIGEGEGVFSTNGDRRNWSGIKNDISKERDGVSEFPSTDVIGEIQQKVRDVKDRTERVNSTDRGELRDRKRAESENNKRIKEQCEQLNRSKQPIEQQHEKPNRKPDLSR